jgi:hypothetical protein
MRRMWLILVVGASLAGCAAHGARTDQGYALYGEGRNAERRAVAREDDVTRSQAWSVHDFAYPRGLLW